MLAFLKQNLFSFVLAIALHVLLIFFILVGVDWKETPRKKFSNVDVIDASLISNQEKIIKEQARKKAVAQKKAKEKAAKEQARKKAVAQKKAKEKAAKEQARKKAVAQKIVAAEAAIRERELKAQFNAENDNSERTRLMALIADKVERNWRQPPGSDGLTCLVQVRLSTTGSVLFVNVVKSSGVNSFDRSVEAAVYRSDPLPVPDSPRLKAEFRKLTFKFDPYE